MNTFNFDDHKQKLDAWARDMMERHGWYVHFVPNDEQFPNGINYHTHGIAASFGHPDLQICFPLATGVAHQIIDLIVDKIKQGITFVPGKKYEEIIGRNLSIEFIEAMECGRRVLRIIFPDQNGEYEEEVFNCQFKMTGLSEGN